MLFEFYGPTPIIPETADPSDENLDYARASVDEMVGHIDQLLSDHLCFQVPYPKRSLPGEFVYSNSTNGCEWYY